MTKSKYIIITESELRSDDYCPYLSTKPNQVCSIVVLIELAQEFYNDEPIFEFNIKSQEIVPAFVRKSMLRKDVIVGNYFQYFFTEVGIQEEGNINIKFEVKDNTNYVFKTPIDNISNLEIEKDKTNYIRESDLKD